MFVLGGSLGANIALRLSIMFPDAIRGLILFSPFIQPAHKMSKKTWVKSLLTLATPILGSLPVPTPKKNTVFRLQSAYVYTMNHPMHYKGRLKLSTVAACSQAADLLYANLENLRAPMIIFRAG